MALGKTQKVQWIVHSCAATAAGIGAGLAQLPAADAVPLCALQASMITCVALVHGRRVSEAKAAGLMATFPAKMFGRKVSQALVGWVPGFGNAINATTAAAITEAIGWAAHAYFENLGAEPASGSTGSVPAVPQRGLLGRGRGGR